MGLITTEYTVFHRKIPKVFNGFRLAVLADLHNCMHGSNNRDLIAAIQKASPNAILVVGDMITDHFKDGTAFAEFDRAAALLTELAHSWPVYYENGNHESRWKRRGDAQDTPYSRYRELLEEQQVHFLENESVLIPSDDGKENIRVTGLELPGEYFTKPRYTVLDKNAIHSLVGEADTSHFQILLAHSPQFFSAYMDWGADLVLAGHFHGGMIRLPFIGGVISTYFRLFPKYDRGRFTGNNGEMIVSGGLGTHTIPLRINNPEQLVMIELKYKEG